MVARDHLRHRLWAWPGRLLHRDALARGRQLEQSEVISDRHEPISQHAAALVLRRHLLLGRLSVELAM